MSHQYELNKPIALTCPECGGAVEVKAMGKLHQYVCHIGHVFSADAMAAAHAHWVELHLNGALTKLNERLELYRQLEDWAVAHGEPVERFQKVRRETREAADIMRELLTRDWRA